MQPSDPAHLGPERAKSIQAWIGYTLQAFLSKTQEETKTFTMSSQQYFNESLGLKFTPRRRNRK